jgi:hypothetical protein
MMTTLQDLYCKIFVNTDITRDSLIRKVAKFAGGHSEMRIITSPMMEIYVDVNDEYDETKSRGEDGFLYFPFCLDIEPVANADDDAYIRSVNRLLENLRAEGFQTAAACDFEDELSQTELSYMNQRTEHEIFSHALAASL